MTQPAQEARRVHIPEITSSLKTLFVLRTIISLGLIVAGIAVLHIGSQMLLTSLGTGNQNVLFEIAGTLKITAGGFGAVVMATSIVPFIFAYKARPTLQVVPTSDGGFSLSSDNDKNPDKIIDNLGSNKQSENGERDNQDAASNQGNNNQLSINKTSLDDVQSLSILEIRKAA